jgi:recombinational DNA repair protein (RecF pathway)
MAAEKMLAIVLRTVAFGETSSIVTLCCREFGKLRALAKGAWQT